MVEANSVVHSDSILKANLEKASLKEVKLEGARLEEVKLEEAGLEEAKLVVLLKTQELEGAMEGLLVVKMDYSAQHPGVQVHHTKVHGYVSYKRHSYSLN